MRHPRMVASAFGRTEQADVRELTWRPGRGSLDSDRGECVGIDPSSSIRVLICDDHAIVRHGLQRLIDDADAVQVVAGVEGGEECVEAALRLRPDVVLMDLVMPGIGGVEATRRIVSGASGARVIALTSFADEGHVLEALDAGAHGYLLKDADGQEILRAIRAVAAGHAPHDPRIARVVLSRRVEGDPARLLTTRELEILSLVADGLANKAIARRLGIAEPTVRKHLTNVYRQIGVNDRTQAALWAERRGLRPP
jgi:DNA-binding NarL/FixJ family response regulator